MSNGNIDWRLTTLDPDDGKVLDSLLAQRAGDVDVGPAAPVEAERSAKIGQVLSVLDGYRVEDPPGDLVPRTLVRIAEVKQRRRFAQQVAALSAPAPSFGWIEFGSLAAALLLMVALALPVLSRHQRQARQIACAAGLQAAGAALRSYAHDYDNHLPRGRVVPGSTWYGVGQPLGPDGSVRSNSQNLFLVVRRGYLHPKVLTCPENPHAPRYVDAKAHDWSRPNHISFSFQNLFIPKVPRLNEWAGKAILADKNPLLVIGPGPKLTIKQFDTDNLPDNLLHKTGQNILTVSGSVRWSSADTPVTDDGDNIWEMAGVRISIGNETPMHPFDSIMVP